MRLRSPSLALLLSALVAPLAAQDPAERKTFTLPHVLEVVGRAVDQPMPAGLSAADQRSWAAQTEWLRSVRSRLEAIGVKQGVVAPRDAASGQATGKRVAAPRDAASGQATGKRVGAPADTAGSPGDSTGTTAEFEALRVRIQQESRRFTTISNVLKTRHETAMNAIRNMKG